MDHVEGKNYKGGCRCSDCRAGHAAYMREWSARRREAEGPEIERECTKCFVVKPIDDFSHTKRNKTGYLRICKECKNAYLRAYMAGSEDQRRKRREYKWEWREAPGNREYENAQQYTRVAKDPDKQALIYRRHLLKKQYGITLEQYDEMAAEQGGCAICGDQPSGKHKYLHVDHCHASGKVRALLCSHCNVALGSFKDDPELMRAAALYIEAHSPVASAEVS